MQLSPFDEILYQGCAVVQKVNCWCLTAEGRTSVQVSLSGRQSATGTGVSASTSVSFCQHHPANARTHSSVYQRRCIMLGTDSIAKGKDLKMRR